MATSTIKCNEPDTGWVNISPLNGLTVGSVFAVRRVGRTVYLTGQNITLPAASHTASTTIIGQVDNRFYPATLRWDVHQARPNTDDSLYLIIRNNGNVELNSSATGSAVNSVFFATSYLAAN